MQLAATRAMLTHRLTAQELKVTPHSFLSDNRSWKQRTPQFTCNDVDGLLRPRKPKKEKKVYGHSPLKTMDRQPDRC